MSAAELCYTPATELGRLIGARQLSPVELTEVVLNRIERLNPQLHAFLTVTSDHTRGLGPGIGRSGYARPAHRAPRRDPVLAQGMKVRVPSRPAG